MGTGEGLLNTAGRSASRHGMDETAELRWFYQDANLVLVSRNAGRRAVTYPRGPTTVDEANSLMEISHLCASATVSVQT
jgi:hypothetical protein